MKRFLLVLVGCFFLISAKDYSQNERQGLESQLNNTMKDLSAYGGSNLAIGTATSSKFEASTQMNPVLARDIEKMRAAEAGEEAGFFDRTMSQVREVMITQLLESNPFAKISRKEVKALILEQISNQKFHQILIDHPAVLEIFVDLLRDDKALLSLVKITLKKKELKLYGIIFLCTFIFNMLINILLDKNSSILKKLFRRIVSNALVFCINMGVFYYLFREELAPTVNIIKSHLF